MSSTDSRILLVEPNEYIRSNIQKSLTEKNFELVCSLQPDEVLFSRKKDDSPIGLVLISDEFDKSKLSESSLMLGSPKQLPQQIPVVVMTEIASRKSPLEAVVNNWFHTIHKPCDPEILSSVVSAAVNQFNHVQGLLDEIETRSSAIGLITSGTFELRSVQQARNLTTMLALACPEEEGIVIGLNELLQNAIEHGNLEIGYNQKTLLLESGELYEEIAKRLDQPPFGDRVVKVTFKRGEKELRFVVEDQGKGFDWRNYLTIDDERLTSSHGRGIAIAKMMAFSDMEYNEIGNRVSVSVKLKS